MPNVLSNLPENQQSPASLAWVKQLIRFDTTSRHSNLGLIETVRDYFYRHGLPVTLTYNEAGKKANLFSTVPAQNGATTGGIVLSGHTDVVPVDGQIWDTDPFEPCVKNGRLYGRGACDMKGFVGIALSLLPEMLTVPLAAPLHFALSYDEEVGCAGAPAMIAELSARGIAPAGCIVGEPTNMRVVVAHKGLHAYQCCVHGHAAHSSLQPQGVNAIEYAARLICFIQEITEQYKHTGPFDTAFDVPFTTIQTGMIAGGIAVNTIPAHCEFIFEYRTLPGIDTAEIFEQIQAFASNSLVPQMRVASKDADITFTRLLSAPPLNATGQATIIRLVQTLQQDPQMCKAAYATEAGLFQQVGIPSIVCGPGNIEQAHKPNEFIELTQLAQCEAFLKKLIASQQASEHLSCSSNTSEAVCRLG